MPQVTNRSTTSRSNVGQGASTRSNDSGTRVGHGATTRGGSNSTTSGITRRSDSGSQVTKPGKATIDDRGTTKMGTRPGGTSKPDGNRGSIDRNGGNRNHGDMDKDRNGNNRPNGNRDGFDRDRGSKDKNGNRDRHGNDRDRNRGNHDRDNGHRGYNPNNRFDYHNHHYRDQFSWNYSHHSWSRPLPPPARAHRPAPLIWRRPVIPVGWHPYAGAPVIDRILGLMFGSLYEASLDHLYYSGYYIDGYADGIIYLRDVPMLNLYWSDVMLNYELNRLANAQFIYHSRYYDRGRFDRVYNSLCRVYGPPVFQDGMTISWYGGNNTGWVTLTMTENYGDYYTTMSIGY